MWIVARSRHQRELAEAKAMAQSEHKRASGAEAEANALASGLLRVATELSDLKDELALHIVAVKHPSSALSDAHSMAVGLQEALAARGVDLRLELARLEDGAL